MGDPDDSIQYLGQKLGANHFLTVASSDIKLEGEQALFIARVFPNILSASEKHDILKSDDVNIIK